MSVRSSDSSQRLVLHSCSKAFIKGLSLHVLYPCKSGLSPGLSFPEHSRCAVAVFAFGFGSSAWSYASARLSAPHATFSPTLYIIMLARIVPPPPRPAHPTPPAFNVP